MNLSKFMRSEIQIQLAGLLIDDLFLPQHRNYPIFSCVPLITMSSLKNTCFQNNLCAEHYLRMCDTKGSTCLLWDITTEKSGLYCYAVRMTQNTYVKKCVKCL